VRVGSTVVLLALLAGPVLGAPRAATVTERLASHALNARPTYALLCELCREAPLRLSGSEGADRAVAWAKLAMERKGLEAVRLEPCLVPRWVRGEVATLRVVECDFKNNAGLGVLALGMSVPTPPGGIRAEVLEVKSLEELRRRAGEAKGRIVLFNRPMETGLVDPFRAYGGALDQRIRGASEAAKVGAVAALVRSLTTEDDHVPHTGTLRYERGVARIPAAAVSTRGADAIASLIASGVKFRVRLELSCETKEDVPGHNVVGELRGRERPDEIVLVGGHLDAWDVGQGAHDDGAGCCQAIAAVALLKKLGLRPRRTIRVVLFTNEENGTRGGKAYAKAYEKELGKHVFALESDRGGFTPRGFSTNANPKALAVLRELAEPLRPLGIEFVRSGGGGVDIGPMGPAGVVLAGYVPDGQRYFDLHHSAKDTLSEVHPRELELGTAAIAALIHAVADRKEPLPRNPAKPKR
jgi:carboxypeptidase Q